MKRPPFPFALDTCAMSDAVAAPGVDPRAWISYGTVRKETPDTKSVTWDSDLGPLVSVVLHPSGVEVGCRVASWSAGIQEGSYYPFQQGDEVIVAIPQGSEDSGCVIIGRLNNGFDTFPTTISGQDATTNTFAFQRLRAPMIIECASSYLIRSAKTGSYIGLTAGGQVVIANGDPAGPALLQLGTDTIGFRSSDATMLCEIDIAGQVAKLETNHSKLQLSETGASLLLTRQALSILTASTPVPQGHAITTEQVLVLLQALMQALGALISASGGPAGYIGGVISAGAIPLVTTSVTSGAALPASPYTGVLQAALAIPPDPTGATAGVGCAGLLIG